MPEFDFGTLLNQGVAVFVMCYFMYFNNTTMKEFHQTLEKNTLVMEGIKNLMEKEEEYHG